MPPKKKSFQYEAVCVEKQYPDMFLIMERRGLQKSELVNGKFVQLNLYAPIELPDELFFDKTVNWHQQHFGKKGLVAATGLYLRNKEVFVSVLQSDFLQQLFRGDERFKKYRNVIEYHFSYWYKMLIESIMNYAIKNGFEEVYVPTGEQLIIETKKKVNPELFLKIYNYITEKYLCTKVTVKGAEYWRATTKENGTDIVCICHDTEGSDEQSQNALKRMLEIEKKNGIRSTYNIVGNLFSEKEPIVRSYDNHSIGFHSFNHVIEDLNQLQKVRQVDLQVRGYRPPQSKITAELTDYNLSYYNFEWFSCSKVGKECFVQNGIAKIPIVIDDYTMVTGEFNYEQWERKLFDIIQKDGFIAFGLHDCYASYWLEYYDDLLCKLKKIAHFRTCDEIANNLFLRGTV